MTIPTCPATNGNTMISAPGATAHGLSLAGAAYSFIAYHKPGKMIVVADTSVGDMKSTKVECLAVDAARTRYAKLLANGAIKCTAKRAACGYNYTGDLAFSAEEIFAVPGTDLQLQWDRSGKAVSAGVSIG